MSGEEAAQLLNGLGEQVSTVSLRLQQRFSAPRHQTVEGLIACFEDYASFLETLDAESRKIFVRRYFWAEPVKELAGNLNISEGKVKSQLFRMRAKLKMHLEKEGIAL